MVWRSSLGRCSRPDNGGLTVSVREMAAGLLDEPELIESEAVEVITSS